MDLKRLADPFPASDVEWRMQSAGEKNGRVWARVLAYITNRAIMERLDDVVGPENWKNEYRYESGGAVLCGISIRTGWDESGTHGEWVTKWDGAENTDIEAVKGGLSNAMKRCGVQWGIGRYLYQLEEGFAKVHDGGENYVAAKQGKYPAFHWDPPQLPAWALPGGSGKPGVVSGAKNGAGVKSATEIAGEVRPHDPAKQDARQQAAPAPSAKIEKPDEEKKWKGRTLGARTIDELWDLLKMTEGNSLLSELADSVRRILEKRDPDGAVRRMTKAVEAEHTQLPF